MGKFKNFGVNLLNALYLNVFNTKKHTSLFVGYSKISILKFVLKSQNKQFLLYSHNLIWHRIVFISMNKVLGFYLCINNLNLLYTVLIFSLDLVETWIFWYIVISVEWAAFSAPDQETPSKKRPSDPSVCICISLVARAVGPSIYKEVHGLLEAMIASGLSSSLTVALQSLAVDIPKLKVFFVCIYTNFVYRSHYLSSLEILF